MNPLILAVPFGAILSQIKQPDVMTELMRRYDLLRTELRRIDEFPELWNKGIVTGMSEISADGVGYNVGKGYEIFICTKGQINYIMHVFLHELAHNTVDEYDHSSKFWDNLTELKSIAIGIGIYEPIGSNVAFCDSYIGD